jgi:hypothetical protein
MKPSTKVFATLSLSAAVGKKIKIMEESEALKALGESLYNAGYEATCEYPYTTLSTSKTRQILDAVEAMLKSPLEPPEILSMLLAGLTDIYAKVKPGRQDIIDPVIYCAQACIDAYPDEPDHTAAWDRYQAWVES